MKAFLDTNVLIDFMAERQGYPAAAALFELAASGQLKLTYSALSVANAFYILRKQYTDPELAEAFEMQQPVAEICGVSSQDVGMALKDRWTDGEDAIQYHSALSSNADVILTHNISDFQQSSLDVMTPEDFLDKYFA
ncbi:MAG: PIN domain-containing protein [Bacteroidaceae bacterium]|nr:PIN domain-containing protein [Bacteroidaceae bacterium]